MESVIIFLGKVGFLLVFLFSLASVLSYYFNIFKGIRTFKINYHKKKYDIIDLEKYLEFNKSNDLMLAAVSFIDFITLNFMISLFQVVSWATVIILFMESLNFKASKNKFFKLK
ncbi:MAG: hypothetical protein AB6733_21260 [Clostridiaceae bacterium]